MKKLEQTQEPQTIFVTVYDAMFIIHSQTLLVRPATFLGVAKEYSERDTYLPEVLKNYKLYIGLEEKAWLYPWDENGNVTGQELKT